MRDTELIQYAAEIKVRAERRCGELLAHTEKHVGGRPTDNRSNDATGSPPTLREMGLTKDESSRYQQLAAMPADEEGGSRGGQDHLLSRDRAVSVGQFRFNHERRANWHHERRSVVELCARHEDVAIAR
jgi:hypothetical protein